MGWRYAGRRYSLNLLYAYLPGNMQHANLKVVEIKIDIEKGCFDTTLRKYNPSPDTSIPPKDVYSPEISKPINSSVYLNDLVNDFNNWGKYVRNVDVGYAVNIYTSEYFWKSG